MIRLAQGQGEGGGTMAILALLFFLTTVVCAIKWLDMRFRFLALAWYFFEKGADSPSAADMDRCLRKVVKHMIKDFIG